MPIPGSYIEVLCQLHRHWMVEEIMYKVSGALVEMLVGEGMVRVNSE